MVFSGDDLFADPELRAALRPAGDSDLGLPGESSSKPDFNTTHSGEDGSNLFADPTAVDLDLDGQSAAVPLGADPHSDDDLTRAGPGSSIFAGSFGPQGSALNVERIPIMASADEAVAEELPFDAPPPSGIGADIFGPAGRPAKPSGVGAVGFDLPLERSTDPDATERQDDGGVAFDLPTAPPGGPGQSSQRSRGMRLEDVAALDPTILPTRSTSVSTDRRPPARQTERAPVVMPETTRRSLAGWLGGGTAGVLAGAGATAAALYLGGFLGTDTVPPRPQTPVAALASIPTGIDPAELEKVRTESATERKRLTDQLTAATGRADSFKAALEKSKAPSPAALADQRKLANAVAEANTAKQAAAVAAGRLEGTTKSLADANARRKAAEAALAEVVKGMKAANLIAADADPVAALAKLPAALQAAGSADAQKAAAAIATANARVEATRAEAQAARLAAEAAKAELAAAQAKSDERAKQAAAEAVAKATQQAEAIRAREISLQQQLAQAQQSAAAERANLEAGFRQQLTDARNGVTVPLAPPELRARDQAVAELGRGMTAYHAGRTAEALGSLESAVALNPADARTWYFLGLAKRRTGDTLGAEAAFRQGADMERKGRMARREVNEALLNVQGYERDVLRVYRP